MTDIRTLFIDMEHGIDWLLDEAALSSDDGLVTAVVLSLFTDARARDDDRLPLGQTDRRGWWADGFPTVEHDRIGSRLWLLRSEKQLQEALNRARDIGEEALAWMIADGVASRVEVETFVARFEVMGMNVRIHRPDGLALPIRFDILWSAL